MKKIYIVVFIFIAFFICSINVFSQAGTLDPAFGNAGRTSTNFFGYSSHATGTKIQADGKMVVGGYSHNGSNWDFALTRYNFNGTLDLTFSGDGRQTTAIGSFDDQIYAIAIQSDGKIVVAGYSFNGTDDDFAIARYTSSGILDISFDGDGKLITTIGSSKEIATSVVVQTDGKIVVAGFSLTGSKADFALARYNTNGSLDVTFSGDGKQTTAIGTLGDVANSISLQADGKIVVAGYSLIGSFNDFAVARYTTTGLLDVTFSGDGKLTTAIGSFGDVIYSVAIQTDGKIVVAGSSYSAGNYDFALARYSTTGVLDISFDVDGKLTTAIGSSNDAVNTMTIQSDGKIVVSGYSHTGSFYNAALARYNTDGSLDVSFDGDGKLTTVTGAYENFVQSIVLQADGKITAAGSAYDGKIYNFAIFRYNIDGSLDVNFDFDGKQTTVIKSSIDHARSMAIQNDGKIIVAGYRSNGGFDDFAIARYTTNGILDPDFGIDGKQTTAIGSLTSYANAIAIQSNGKIILAGYSYNVSNTDFTLARYNADGSLDPGFDGDGILTTDFAGSFDYINAMAIQTDGKIIVAGRSNNGTNDDFALARYNINGSLDISFDGDGKLAMDFAGSDDFVNALVIQTDGKIIVAGYSTNGIDDEFALARYHVNGSLDISFSGDGKLTTDIAGSYDFANAIAIQSDGKIVVTGQSSNGSDFDFALTRYNADGSLDVSFDGDGKLITVVSVNSVDRAHSIAIQNNGKIVVAGFTNNGSNYDFALVRYNTDGSLDPGFDADGKVLIDLFPGSNDYSYAMKLYSNRIYIAGDITLEGTHDFALASLINDAYPLPLSLLEFSGHFVSNSCVLNWKTTNELNAHSFNIERSIDGRTYTKVGNVAAFNTPGDHQYNFTDNNINLLSAPVVYYRLKQKDIDGRFTYSSIVALSMDDSKSIVMLYPNPVKDEANLTITVNKKQQVQGRIIDNAGRVVKQMQWNLTAGSTALPVDVKGLAKGIYYLELKGETINERKQFVKQ